MLNKRWKIKESGNDYLIKSLTNSLSISDILANLLVLRNITNFDQAKTFFRPSLENLNNPFLMDGMEAATYRVIQAVSERQLICIYGDYDVDGTCSTALLYLFLKELGANVEYYIPKRLTEGYGISKSAIDYVKSKDTSLLISVDCGITAIEEAEYVKELGMDLIICDHHQPKDEIPNALAVLDPLKPNCNYPFKFLSGAGVAFKLAQGVAERIGKRDLPLAYLDLVALAGAADIVPLVDENRILVREGLNIINTNPRPGIVALIENSKNKPGALTSGQIVFTIAPRINAVGRLGDADRAVNLLITNDKDEAYRLAKVLESENYERRKIDEDTLDDALELLGSPGELKDCAAIVLHQDKWHPGVIGIVASRLVEKYYRPTIMLTTVDGIAKGSARSISNFNIYEALKQCEDLLIHYGGHQAAAGLAVELEKIDEFKSKFNQIVQDSISKEDLLPEIHIDTRLNFSEITPKFLRIIDQFAPFGPGNMRPVFLSEDVEVVNTPRIISSKHLIINFRQSGCDKIFDAIGFNMSGYFDLVNTNNSFFDIVYNIDYNSWEGKNIPQLKLKDLKIKKNIRS